MAMFYSVVPYDQPLFRPPGEAHSLIFQVTIGCSWNRCAFCEMYTSKKFRVKCEADVESEITYAARHFPEARKLFLGDGNAMVISTSMMLAHLANLSKNFAKLTRVSAYASPSDLNNKTVEELTALHQAGLKLLYVGVESGDDQVLKAVQKGETFSTTVAGLLKAKQAGINLSVMIITGLGGKHLSNGHAFNSAKIVNEIQPEFLSTLVLSFPYGPEHFRKRFRGDFIPLNTIELLQEQHNFIAHTELNRVIFRSDHASNYLALKGILGRDKHDLLHLLQTAIQNPGIYKLREEWERGL
jgi:radical SAM superfamily enzyme YgiQ (UPF0313 family)